MAKISNNRIFLSSCLLLIVGIFVILGFVYGYQLYSILAIILVLTLLTVMAVVACKVVRSVILLIFFCIGCFVCILQVSNNDVMMCHDFVELKGTIDSMVEYEYTTLLVLDDVSYDKIDEHGQTDGTYKPLNGKTTTYISNYDLHLLLMDEGDRVYMRANMDNIYVMRDSINSFAYKYGYKYEASSAHIYKVVDQVPTFVQKANQYIFSTLQRHMPDSFGTAYALLVGDKAYMADDQYDMFRNAGVAHLFAISGMHIGIFASVFNRLLNRLRVYTRYRIYFIMPPLLLYGYLCGFSPSISRALLMIFVTLLSQRWMSGSDMLSSIAIAMIVILVVKPLYIFDVGFLLSFGAVFGIATIGYGMFRVVKRKTENKAILYFTQLIFLTVAVTISTFFIVAHYFGEVAIFGLITNIIAMPLISVVFVLCLLGLVPCCGVLLQIAQLLLEVIASVSLWVSSLPLATINVPSIGLTIIVIMLILYVLGEYLNLKARTKTVVLTILIMVAIVSALATILPKPTIDQVKIYESDSQMLTIITEKDSDVVNIVNNIHDIDDVNIIIEELSSIQYQELYVHCTDVSAVQRPLLMLLRDQTKLNKLYYYNASYNESIMNCGVKILRVDKAGYVNNSIRVSSIYSGGLVGLDVVCSHYHFALLDTPYSYALFGFGKNIQYDFVYCASDVDILKHHIKDIPILVPMQLHQSNIYGINMYGNFTIVPKDDIILVNRGRVQ